MFKRFAITVIIQQRGEGLIQFMKGLETGEHKVRFLQALYADVVQRTLADGEIYRIIQYLSVCTDELLYFFILQHLRGEFRLAVQPPHKQDEGRFDTGGVYVRFFMRCFLVQLHFVSAIRQARPFVQPRVIIGA